MATNCGCGTTSCQTTQCGCQALISSDCVNNVKSNFECLDIASNQTLTATLEQMDAQICALFNSITNYFTILNVGAGAGVYKGVNLLGQKELKSLTKTGDLIVITSSTNEINFTIDEAELTNFINELIPAPPEATCIESESLAVTEEEGCFKVELEVVSNTLTVTQEEPGVIRIEQPETTDILRFIVNSAYTGDEETGSASKPYKTIQGAVTAYIGTETPQTPQFINAEIIIQKGVGYTYTGDFSFNTGTGSIILEEGTVVTSNPTGDWLCDFDTLSDTDRASLSIVLREGSILQLIKNGFRNRGTSINDALLSTVKNISISGAGVIFQATNDNTNITYTVFESNFVGTDTFYNDSGATFNLRGVTARSRTQQIIKIGGNSEFLAEGSIFQSEATNANIKLFNQIGGRLRINTSTFNFLSATPSVFFSLTKNSSSLCNVELIDCIFNVITTTLFQNENTNQSVVILKNVKNQFGTITNIAKSPNVLWTNFRAFNCIFSTGEVDQTQVDLTLGNIKSTSNIFAGKLVESLQVFASRALAVSSGTLKKGNAFINRKIVNGVDLVAGIEYQVLTSGSPSLGTVGDYFTATGSETSTGTAYSYTRDILI